MTDRDRAMFQMFEERLCMPFDVFHEAIEKALGRPVWTHEFGLNREGLQKIPARSSRSGEKGAGFDSPVVDSGEPKDAAGPAVSASAESDAGASSTEPVAHQAQERTP